MWKRTQETNEQSRQSVDLHFHNDDDDDVDGDGDDGNHGETY